MLVQYYIIRSCQPTVSDSTLRPQHIDWAACWTTWSRPRARRHLMSWSLMSGCRTTCYCHGPSVWHHLHQLMLPSPGGSGSISILLPFSPNCQRQIYVPVTDPATESSADDLADTFDSVISGLLDKHAPVSEFTVRERSHQPWFDNECREARRKARRLARRCQTDTAVQRISKPGAQPYVRLGSCPIRRPLITGSRKSRRPAKISVMCGSQWTSCLARAKALPKLGLSLLLPIMTTWKRKSLTSEHRHLMQVRRFLLIVQLQACASSSRSPRKMSLKSLFLHQQNSALLTYFQRGSWRRRLRYWRLSSLGCSIIPSPSAVSRPNGSTQLSSHSLRKLEPRNRHPRTSDRSQI